MRNTLVRIIPAKQKPEKILRVAVYARVSKDKDAAFHSLEAQKDYYEKYVRRHKNWELFDIYSDNGISGTTINRPEFQRMMDDARARKFDQIITKSISRFARNIVVLLHTTRELKDLDIDVYFEKERIHSISGDGELLLSLLSIYAEEEAKSTSKNMLWSVRKKFEAGQPWVFKTYGYRFADGEIEIVPEEAEIVKRIYEKYLEGEGSPKIAIELNNENIPSPKGGFWTTSTIAGILRNRTYTGELWLQKTFCPDFRTKKRRKNIGQVRKYLVRNNHPVIIEKEVYNLVQKEIKNRTRDWIIPEDPHLFTGLIQCENCKMTFTRSYSKKQGIVRWVCSRYRDLGAKTCPVGKIREDVLIEKAKEVLEIPEITREALQREVKKIIVCENKKLKFILKNGETKEARWENPPKRWSDEARRKARENALSKHKRAENG